jgi:PhoH-like ATPase
MWIYLYIGEVLVKKNYILDTNVLIHDPQSMFKFEDNNLYIPIYVLEELDKLKSEPSIRGRNSREACRLLDELRCQGSLSQGISVGEGKLTIYVPKDRKVIKVALDSKSMDNAILQCSLELQESSEIKTILVTMDVNLRVRAECIGIQTASYESQSVDVNTLDNEVKEIIFTKKEIDEFYASGIIGLSEDLFINSSILLKDEVTGATALGRVKFENNIRVIKKLNIPANIMGLKPRNAEQKFALDLLLDDSVKFVTLMGTAGSGKSIVSVASALYSIFETNTYAKLLVSRPVMPMGKDIGYLPGTADEKLRPFMQPIYDNIDYILMSSGARKKYKIDSCQKLFDDNIIEIEPLVYIRGRSIINQIMIIDECFPYSTLISTQNGKFKIGNLFKNWIKGNKLPLVKSFDEKTKTFVWKEIVNMFYNGIKELVEVVACNRKIKCTANHPFLTDRGWVEAINLTNYDLLISDNPDGLHVANMISGDVEQMFYGSFLGDGSIQLLSNKIGRLSINHGLSQSNYCKWKANFFGCSTKLIKNSGYNPHEDKIGFCTKSYGLTVSFPRPKIYCPPEIIDKLDERGLAIWFMDDGAAYKNHNGCRIHTESFNIESVKLMSNKLNSWGIDNKIAYYKGNVITINKIGYIKLCKLIAPYIHEELKYKIAPEFRNVKPYTWNRDKQDWGVVAVKQVKKLEKVNHVLIWKSLILILL